jgi:hypothetical protein
VVVVLLEVITTPSLNSGTGVLVGRGSEANAYSQEYGERAYGVKKTVLAKSKITP